MAVKDLSTVHELVSDIFKWPATAAEWEEYKLSDEQVDFFNENGFLSGIKLLDEKQIGIIRNELAQIADPKHEGHELFMNFIPMNLQILLQFFFMHWVSGG